jgi:Regulator of ribonuclease activity B
MRNTYPDDADGDALRRVASEGGDMSHPMAIDFFVTVPNRQAGETVAHLAALSGYKTDLVHDAEDDA